MSETETEEPTPESPSEEAPQEDPEITALKEQIAKLESEVNAKKSSLSAIQEMADIYTKEGYARQVAHVENNKRMRRGNMANSKQAAWASVVQTFLPVMDELDAVGAKYEGNEFAQSLGALRSEFMNALGELGVSEFGANVGDMVDGERVVATSEEFSEECAKGTVISGVKNGFEIQGNIVRPAECVGSLGSEKAEEEEEEEASAEEGATGAEEEVEAAAEEAATESEEEAASE